MAPLDARIHNQKDARSSKLVKGSREQSRDAKVVGRVQHAEPTQDAPLNMLNKFQLRGTGAKGLSLSRAACSANSKMDEHDVSSFITSGCENEATSKKQFLSDQLKLL